MSTRDHFDIDTVSFAPDAVDEARLLLRPVLPLGNHGEEPAFLPTTLAGLVGRPCELTAGTLRNYLSNGQIEETALGGSLADPLCRSGDNSPDGVEAKYFVIHDTSSPTYNTGFPGNINTPEWDGNRLSSYMGTSSVAHLFVNRVGQSATGHGYGTPWRATRLEGTSGGFGILMKGLFLHHELIQPRVLDSHGLDSIAPDPGFTAAQYGRLALLYVAASVRRRTWLIPGFHCILDDFLSGGHDDPQKFSLAQWDGELSNLLGQLGQPAGVPQGGGGAPAQGVAPLFADLVTVYAGTQIEFPNLKTVTVAQWILESGRGSSALAQQHLNFGGLKYRPEMAGWATRVWYEAHDGGEYYCKFDSLAGFVRGYWQFMDRSPYAGWRNHAATGEDYINFVGPTYDTAAYPGKVIPLMPEAKLLLDAASDGNGVAVNPLVQNGVQPAVANGVIVIDPGHGGSQVIGGSSPNNATARPSGIKEKAMTLDMVLRVRSALGHLAPNVAVHLTRDSDVNVGIGSRAKLADEKGANLFMSIHFNGTSAHQARGVETWVRAASNGNMNLAGDVRFAEKVQRAAYDAIRAIDGGTRDRGIKYDSEREDPLGVLNDNSLGTAHNGCLACLIELEFIDVPAVDALFNTGLNASANKDAIAASLAKALVDALPHGEISPLAASEGEGNPKKKAVAKKASPKKGKGKGGK